MHVALFVQVSSAYLIPKLIVSCKLDLFTTKRNENDYTLYVSNLNML